MSGNRREQRDRECGLIFSWRSTEFSTWGTCAAVVIVAVLGTAFFGLVRIRIMPPPRIIERHAAMVMIPSGPEGQAWATSIDEQGPFPSRYDVASDPAVKAIEAAFVDSLRARSPHTPEMRDLPLETAAGSVPVSLRGERIFPRESPEARPAIQTSGQLLTPVLVPLSNLPDADRPRELPPYQVPVSPVMAAKSWRFMLELGPRGQVIQQLPIERSEDAAAGNALKDIGEWLGRVKFGNSAKPGWIGIEVSFTRTP